MPASLAQWKPEAIADLIRRARSGESWAAIGLAFYPASTPQRARHSAATAFGRYAKAEDRIARRAVLAARGFNQPEHYSNRGRPAGVGIGIGGKASVEPPLKREREDLFAGMGRCFG